MNGRVVGVIGVVLALWMALGRWAFGIGGSLTLWYLPTIALTYSALQLWLGHRLRVTRDRGRRIGRATVVSLVLSWACALGFGLTVPDLASGGLASIMGLWTGSALSTEMSIALCNPLGIIAFATAIAALAFSYADARDPRPEEDEYGDEPGTGHSRADETGGTGMAPHPLA